MYVLRIVIEAPIPTLFTWIVRKIAERFEYLDAKVVVYNVYHLDKRGEVKQVQQYGRLEITFLAGTQEDMIRIVKYVRSICPYEVCRISDTCREIQM